MVIIPYFFSIDNSHRNDTLNLILFSNFHLFKYYSLFLKGAFFMDSCEKEFESASQEARRLAIALKRFTEVQDPVWKEKYQHYLSLRFRPAIIELIRQDDFFRIQKLCQFVSITESALDTFIEEAVRLHREEILSFFLEFQKDHFGFHDHDFTF